MKTYEVEVKAYFTVQVEAESYDEAGEDALSQIDSRLFPEGADEMETGLIQEI